MLDGILQMQYPVLDLLSAALVPILCSDISAGTACNIHFALIRISALGADPNQLSVIFADFDLTIEATCLTVVALGVQFRIHDMIIDILHDFQNGINILLHIGYFHITDGTAGAKLLEFRFKGQLREGVNFFAHMDMVRISDVTLVCDTRDNTKTLLQTL